ncbi:hypothetical protein JZU46_00330, partial [bacterium]|nr:hypothetical protein [bacterium]
AGINAFGLDYYYQYVINDLCPISGGYWSTGTAAGVWYVYLSYARGNSTGTVGFRSALYL